MSETSLKGILFACTAAVVVGVVLEGYEHWDDLKTKGWKPILPKIGFAVLVLGLAGELLIQPFIDRAENDFRLDAKQRILDAQLEQERLRAANLKLEGEIQPRFLSPGQEVAFRSEVSVLPSTQFKVSAPSNDVEAAVLGSQLQIILRDAQWNGPLEPRVDIGLVLGIAVLPGAGPFDAEIAEKLVNALNGANLYATMGSPQPGPLEIRVGAKPLMGLSMSSCN